MCGRFTITAPASELAELMGLPEVPEVRPRYNVAPSQMILAARLSGDGRREAALLKWGLVPSWATDPKIGYKMINARGETIATKPSFRHAFKKQRCLIAADGFYEWKKDGRSKRPFRFHRRDSKPFAFAGLWERWHSPVGEPLDSCTIITTTANATLRAYHDRMPVILSRDAFDMWLTPGPLKPGEADQLISPAADDFLIEEEVSPIVNSPKIDDPRCIVPITG